MIRKLLIANRGEIAVRIIKAAREMGIRTVAVFSDADAHQTHVALADEAIAIGPSEPSASYLAIEKLIESAHASDAEGIHPGYGFLSERAEFSRACRDAGLIFVGPPPEAMESLGSKIEAKQLAVRAGVPVVPGFFEPRASRDELRAAADRIGYPIMLKASAGGGGRGMRIVREASDFDAELDIASDEAFKAFGDGEMMVEKLIERPRHVELQILVDSQGKVATLFERECSIQRRHQKLIEESPSPGLGRHPELYARMRDAGRSLATAAGYRNAGTVEFIVDDRTGDFYFLEVNARLQVEHPVTEMITGLDLVKWQIRVACGEPLLFDQPSRQGHAIEVRIVAEDPAYDFRPSAGRILAWAEPKAPGVRIDTGYGPDAEIPRFYDSLLAKVIAHAETRDEAIDRLEAALLDFHILGVRTNIAYLLDVIRRPAFRSGDFDTGFLEREFLGWQPSATLPPELTSLLDWADDARKVTEASANSGAWDILDGFRLGKGS